jgi:DNA repair protein RecO (recombination protein O)
MSRPGLVEHEPAFVLHQRPYRDTSALLEIITAGHGRVGLVARGVRGSRSARKTALLPFRRLSVSWSGRGELRTLRGADAHGPPAFPTGQRLLALYYTHELILRLTARDDPHPAVFEAYSEALAALLAGQGDAGVLRRFEFCLLDALGYGLDLTRDAGSGEAVDPLAVYRFVAGEGLYRTGGGARGAGSGSSVPGRAVLALASGAEPGRDDMEALRKMLAAALAPLLGDRPLRTRAVLTAMRKRPLAQ